jgi:tRNA(Ile)-lysidine synthase
MLNLIRGCGPDGLAGMSAVRAQNERISIARPLLGVDRSDVLAFLRARRQAYRRDATNGDTAYLRNYLRARLFKDLEARVPGFARRLARLADLVRDEALAWEETVTGLMSRMTSPHRGGSVVNGRKMKEIPVALQRRLLRRVTGRDLLTFDGVEKLRHWMHAPPSGGRFWQLRKGWTVERLSRSKGSPTASLFWFHRTRSKTGKGPVQG